MQEKIAQPPSHFGKRFAGRTVEWLPSDTKENYEQLLKDPEYVAYIAQQGWDRPGAITYRFNSHGFRCEEFDGGPYLLALGCSFTVGIGLPLESTWPYLVGKELGLKAANLGWAGYSNDTCYRLAEYWVPALKPDYVVMLSPPKKRLELLLDPDNDTGIDFEVFLPRSQSSLANNAYLKHWLINDENAEINKRKNQLAVEKFCENHGIPCFVLDSEKGAWWIENGYARDRMHSGPETQRIVANKAVEFYRSRQ